MLTTKTMRKTRNQKAERKSEIRVKYPDMEEIKGFWRRFRTPKNVIDHSRVTAKIAGFLAFKLKQKGVEIDPYFVEAGALLHDALRFIDVDESRFKDFNPKGTTEDFAVWKEFKEKFKGKNPLLKQHEYAIFAVLKDDYPELADALIRHGFQIFADDKLRPKTLEAKLINYADKRVEFSRIVSLKERFVLGHARNDDGKDISKIEKMFYELESEIFSKLDFGPEQLEDMMEKVKAIIFDFDGVIVDSKPILFKSFIETMEQMGIETKHITDKEYQEIFFNSWDEGVKTLTGPRRDEFWQMYRKRMESYKIDALVFPGIQKMLEELSKRFRLGVLSDSYDNYVFPISKNNDIERFFSYMHNGRDFKPSPQGLLKCIEYFDVWKTNIIFVGDMNVDIVTARNANVEKIVAVSYGYHEKKHLSNAWKTVSDVQELKGLLVKS